MSQTYVVVAKPELLTCDGISHGYKQVFREVFSYSFPDDFRGTAFDEETRVALVKQIFLANMRCELGDNFFSGKAPLTTQFFDRWWTVQYCSDEPAILLLSRIDAEELDRIRSAHPEPVREKIDRLLDPSADPNEQSPLDEMHDYVVRKVAGGFPSCQSIIDSASSIFGRDHNKHLVHFVIKRSVDEELEKHYERQASWPAITDCDRLDRAFDELNRSGIYARQNALCCDTCAGGQVGAEIEALIKAGTEIRGYTYYHEQATDNAVSGGAVHLSYGSEPHDADSALEIANEICAMIRRHGLKVKWNGRYSAKIAVTLDWKKRREVE